jgi:hypothetical protein
MRKINKLFNKQTPSIIVVILSYLLFNLEYLYDSKIFNKEYIFIFIIFIAVIQFGIYNLYNQSNKFWKYIATIIYTLVILIFFSYNIADIINIWQIKIIGRQFLRVAYIIPLVSFLLIFLEFWIIKKIPSLINFQNLFFVFLSIVTLSLSKIKRKKEFILDKQFINFDVKNTAIKPVILIVVDEYNSPVGLTDFFKDSSLYNFSNELLKNKWIIKKNMYSYETSTIHSLSSLLNFNLSKNKNFKYLSVNVLGSEKLMKSALIDSLSKKGVEIVNLGIFDLGNKKPLNRLYYYPKNFFELLISKSVIPYMERYISELQEKEKNKSYLTDIHNKQIFKTLPDALKRFEPKTFIYIHLYMPHSPFLYGSEFKYRKNNNTNYLAYWKFTNSKLESVLQNLTSQNKYRIILTGDHGYRDDKNINPHLTFTSFFGFRKEDINKITSVQDLGSLINGSF